ncbi:MULTISPECIES: DEAD/DEAH box helicase [unclassified Bradyrhizobium]|uniref:DEAD/DEAH box helicase n=1 Tax=unclassified Bradyrhizobium TaxID=2631580 RepID=UPI00102EAC32|nr:MULTISPECIES: DEAD/DEAH box helicase [unclassified Bradyrhizobium]MDI4235833.1 DEAD/DEAH box helicase [Bradyrhizobium sp. Arg237L]TAI62814.1 helicase SNF2 [Bradyrhizobium sp. Leo170]
MRSTRLKPATKPGKEPKLSRTQAPGDLSPVDWQRGLRRQFGREQAFGLENLGSEPYFSEFRVSNPASESSYRVAIRGLGPGGNFCSCPDYATSELGTCKHIEFTLARLEKKRGARAAFARGYQPAFSELYLRNEGKRSVYFRAGTDCPPAVSKAAGELFDVARNGILPEERFGELEPFMAVTSKHGHELHAYDDALDFVAGRRDADRRASKLEQLFPRGAADPKLLALLKVPLYPYQAEGALFAVRAGRALIGDEMGLGKTIQAIAATEILARHFGVSKVLVICPTSLKYQWQSEVTRFSGRQGENAARVISGGRAQRQKEYALDDFCKITNYEKLKPDLDLIAAWAPELVIVDEAQRVKNWNTIAARALKRIDSSYAIVLTGTPLENKLEELISIVQFVDQHRLGPTWKLLHEHQVRDEAGRVTGYTGLEKIGQTLAPVMIRRRKSEVLRQLPSRTDQNLLVPMTEMQMLHHRDNADQVAKIVQRWRKTRFLSDKDQRRLACALQNMRMSCNSTYLLDQETDHGVKADELAALFDQLFAEPDAKAVVFSQWTRTHDIIIRRLEARGLGYVSFHGGVPSDKRPALVAQFRDDPACRVFLSTDAGSTGLNLQHASTLVNVDLPWNPAILEQRIARVHRLGQARPVRVINFVAKGTIEEGMLSVLAFKRSLSAGILDGGSGEISLGGSRLTRFMKEVENVTGNMGDGETVTPAEEVRNIPATDDAEAVEDAGAFVDVGAGKMAIVRTDGSGAPPHGGGSDPWQALVQVGVQLMGALAAANDPDAPSHPWIERDPTTGVQNLKVPLPPPEAATQLASALSALAESLRSRNT